MHDPRWDGGGGVDTSWMDFYNRQKNPIQLPPGFGPPPPPRRWDGGRMEPVLPDDWQATVAATRSATARIGQMVTLSRGLDWGVGQGAGAG